ncbi:MAG: DNA transformation protein [Candidatus Azotimanducaceae bacterium]|jgi:DNA transformation protein
MSTSSEFTDYVLDQLESVGAAQTSKMFGGVLLKVDNKQLGVIIMDTLYFKVKEPELQEKFENMGSERFEYTRKDKEDPVVIKNWWSVPEESLENREELVALAYEVLLQGS